MVDEELHFLLIQCYNYNNRLLARKTMAAGLHLLSGQPKILECLWEADGSTPGNLSRHCALDKSTITSLVSKMEEQGLVSRRAHSADRRSVRIFLTERGRKLAAAVKQVGYAVDECALQNLSPEEQRTLIALLGRVRRAFEEEM